MVPGKNQVIMQKARENRRKPLRTQGRCIKGSFGRWIEVGNLGTKDMATTKGRGRGLELP